MLLASADLRDADPIEGCNFERCIGLCAFLGIKTALTLMIISATNHISVTRQEDSVRSSAANLNNLLLKHIEGLQPQRQVGLDAVSVSELAVLVVTPAVYLSLRLVLLLHTAVKYG